MTRGERREENDDMHTNPLVRRRLLAGLLALLATAAGAADDTAARLDAALAGAQRSEANRARDVYRHPKETLAFFGLRSDMTVVEISPGGGWYTEILGPVLRGTGRLYAAHFPAGATGLPAYLMELRAALVDRIAAEPDVFGDTTITELTGAPDNAIAPPGSADLALTFRNVHNWLSAGTAQGVFAAMFRALKSGGVLGVVEHRAPEQFTLEQMKTSGYVTEAEVIRLAQGAGFELADRSEVNANPKDTKDHPEGVWTLPPRLKLGDKDREKYLAIGESDRMTLKFVKP